MSPRTQLAFLDHLQSQNYAVLGFLSRTSLREYVDREQADFAFHNGEACGYLLWYEGRNGHRNVASGDALAIRQACIDYDVRLLDHGRDLVCGVVDRAWVLGYRRVTCWVGSDIPAVSFWEALGFVHDGTRFGRGRRHRTHFHFSLSIPDEVRDFCGGFV